MTLRQFVNHGEVGTASERRQFEDVLLKGWADANEHGLKMNPNVDGDPELWRMGFEMARNWGLVKQA